MKVKVSKKQMMEGYKNIIVAGYCDIESLMNCKEANYYTCGVYGWNADIYVINNNTIIVTGYRPFGNIRNYDLTKKYDDLARKITYNWDIDFEAKTKKLDKLILKYVDEIINNNKK